MPKNYDFKLKNSDLMPKNFDFRLKNFDLGPKKGNNPV